MPRFRLIAVFPLILSLLLTGCSLSLAAPSPQTLMAVFTKPFICGFTFSASDAEPLKASLVRTGENDLLTVYGDAVNTVFQYDGASLVLLTHGTEALPPLQLSVAALSQGAAASIALFSVLPDESFLVSRSDDYFVVSESNYGYSATFSAEGIPQVISLNEISVTIDSFTTADPSIS